MPKRLERQSVIASRELELFNRDASGDLASRALASLRHAASVPSLGALVKPN